MKRCFPKPKNDLVFPCLFTTEELLNGEISAQMIVKDYIFGRFDIADLYGEIYEPDERMIDIAHKIIQALKWVPLETIIDWVLSSEIENCSSDRVPLIFNMRDPFVELELLKEGPLNYESLGNKLPGCKSSTPTAQYKYGEVCSKILALMDLVWIYKGTLTSAMISPMGIAFLSLPPSEQEELTAKLLLKLEVIRNIYRTKSEPDCINVELSKWLSGSTVGRRRQSIELLIKIVDKQR